MKNILDRSNVSRKDLNFLKNSIWYKICGVKYPFSKKINGDYHKQDKIECVLNPLPSRINNPAVLKAELNGRECCLSDIAEKKE